MTKRIFILGLLLLLVATFSFADDDLPGTVYFTNGSVQKFYDFDYLFRINDDFYGIWVYYENSDRFIPFEYISSLEIQTYQLARDEIKGDSKWDVKFKTGKEIKGTSIGNNIQGINIRILDELTGEIKEQYFPIAIENKLSIKKIVFN